MSKYLVRFYKQEVVSVLYSMEVEADTPDAAKDRVSGGWTGEYEFTAEEDESVISGREELQVSEYDGLATSYDPELIA